MRTIPLDTPEACLVELERCSNGLAVLDHLFNEAVDSVNYWEPFAAEWEADAARAVGEKGITATELKGRITKWMAENEAALEAQDELASARAALSKIERFYRSLEKRGGHAQSALNKHEAAARYAGHGEAGR